MFWCVQGALPIPGAKNAAQMAENINGALGWDLTAAQVAALDEAANTVPVQTTQNIFNTA